MVSLAKIFLFKIAHKFIVSLRTDDVLDLMKYNYSYFGSTLSMYLYYVSKRFLWPYLSCQIINLCFLLICVFNGLDVLDKCLHLKISFATFLFLLTPQYNCLDVFGTSINMPADYKYIRLLCILKNYILYAFCDNVEWLQKNDQALQDTNLLFSP